MTDYLCSRNTTCTKERLTEWKNNCCKERLLIPKKDTCTKERLTAVLKYHL